MIKNKNELIECIKIEERMYKTLGYKNYFRTIISNSEIGYIFEYIKLLRKLEYFENMKTKNPFHIFSKILIKRKKNSLGLKLGMNIPINTCDSGLLIYHATGIIINSQAKIGKNCKIHGDICIGNDGKDDNAVPTLGDNVDIGVGAKIIGKVNIGDNTVIGANAVVLKGNYEDDSVLVGIPAKNIKKREYNGKS